MKIFDVLQHALTEKDNATFCPVRIGGVTTGVLYHIAAGVGVLMHSVTLDMASLGMYIQHMMTLVGVSGATIGVKSVMKADADGDAK